MKRRSKVQVDRLAGWAYPGAGTGWYDPSRRARARLLRVVRGSHDRVNDDACGQAVINRCVQLRASSASATGKATRTAALYARHDDTQDAEPEEDERNDKRRKDGLGLRGVSRHDGGCIGACADRAPYEVRCILPKYKRLVAVVADAAACRVRIGWIVRPVATAAIGSGSGREERCVARLMPIPA